jgi:hypothetical protein
MPVAATQWECRTTGSNNNGGGYSSGGTDYSQQNAAQLTVTDAAAVSTTNLSSATGGFTSNMVGNVVNVVGQGRRTITAFVDTNNVTCNAAWGTFAAATANVGGALLDVETALANTGAAIAGNIVWIANGTYTLTVTRSILADGTATNPIEVIGYNGSRTRADLTEANMPVFTSATNSVAIFTTNAATNLVFRNIKVTHTAATRGNGWVNITVVSTNLAWINCIADGCLSGWLIGASSATACAGCEWSDCTARNCTGTGTSAGGFVDNFASAHFNMWRNCYSHDNAGVGFKSVGLTLEALLFINCIADTNTQSGFLDGATTAVFGTKWIGCTSYGNTQHGFRSESTTGGAAAVAGPVNCIAYGNSQRGYSCATTAMLNNGNSLLGARNNAAGANTAGNYENWATPEGAITLTADPFTNAAAGDFSLNTTAGGGAALRELAFPAAIGLTSNFASVGAAEPQATAGGSTRGYIIGG